MSETLLRSLRLKWGVTRSTLINAGFGIGLLASLVVFGSVGRVAHATAADCDNNAVMYCGYSGTVNFIEKARSNTSGNGFKDLQAIYAAYGFPASEYDTFASKARTAQVYRDGTIKVDGVTVGTSAVSWGRDRALHSGTGMQTKPIPGTSTTLYGNSTSKMFASDPIEARILFDDNGTAKFVVLRSCGNPVTASFTPSSVNCNMLNKTAVNGKANTYRFTTNASASGNAKITKYVYDFGDGSPTVTMTNPSTPVEHAYSKAGRFTAKVTVYATTPGEITTTRTCETVIEVLAPYAACAGLKAALINNSDKYTYMYTATTNYGNGASFVSADFDFGDGTKQTGVKSADGGKTVSAKHTYKSGGDYTTSVTLQFSENGKTTSKTCKTTQTVVNAYGRCVSLGGSILDASKYSYRYVATVDSGNGASFVSADFDFGDGTKQTGVKSADGGKTVSVDHTYASAGNYTTSATLRFDHNGKTITADACRAFVTPTTPPTPECKPGVAVGDTKCNPCQYNANYSADDTQNCVAPTPAVLPNTGAGNAIALSAAVLVGGFLWYRHMLFKRHKAAYLAADLGTSPLPLADPLESQHPLAGTPLAPTQRSSRLRSLRRRRF